MLKLSAAEARLLLWPHRGLPAAGPSSTPDRRSLRRLVERIGLLQIDSVDVLSRAHYLPAFSRLGPYPAEVLNRMAYQRPRELFEYWGHEASPCFPKRLSRSFAGG